MATRARFGIPGTYLVTRRTSERRFFLRPDDTINALLLYVLCCASLKYGVTLHAYTFLSNHWHLLLSVLMGESLSRFLQYFCSLTARAINCYRGRKENLWSSGKPNCVLLPPRAEDVVDKISYVVTNAVLSELVDRMSKWPGVKISAQEVGGMTITVKRPNFFFRKKGRMPEEVTVTTCLPPCVDATPEELLAMIQKACAERESEKRGQMVDQGRPFLGVQKILTADPTASPGTPDPLFGLEPHIACKDRTLRIALLARLQRFWDEYKVALLRFRSGQRNTVFPWGTLKMVRDLGCRAGPPDVTPSIGGLALH